MMIPPAPNNPAPQKQLRILLVEDHPITRQGLRAVIEAQPNLAVCGEADTAEQGLELSRKLEPDIAVVDITLRSGNGLDLTHEIRAQAPGVAVLVLSMYDETGYAERALRAGAQGYLTKANAADKLVAVLESVARGEVAISAAEQDRIMATCRGYRRSGATFPIDTISEREREVFGLLGEGYSTKQIAAKLGLSTKTIDTYREHLKEKLGLRSGEALVSYAIKWGHMSGSS